MFFRCLSGLLVLACAGTCAVLRVCADPQNLPFSNQAREGLDNRVAEIVANGLDATLEFVWWPERKASVAQFLDAGNCDVWFGAPSGLPSALTTKPYYRSSYVFISRRDRVGSISSLFDERFSSLRIGAQIVGDDYAPPALVLARRGLSANLAGFSLFGPEGEPNPAARIVDAVDTGAVDVAIVWGPVAGYFAKRAKSPLEITSVRPAAFAGIPFAFDITAAVSKNKPSLRAQIDQVLERECPAIRALLAEYSVPLEPEEKTPCASLQP